MKYHYTLPYSYMDVVDMAYLSKECSKTVQVNNVYNTLSSVNRNLIMTVTGTCILITY